MLKRYKALWEAYQKALRNPEVKNHYDAIRIAIESPSPRYWISPAEASRQISRLRKGLPVVKYKENSKKLQVLMAVYERFKELEKLRAYRGASTEFITTFAVLSPAPCFYMSFPRARKIIDRIHKLKSVCKTGWEEML